MDHAFDLSSIKFDFKSKVVTLKEYEFIADLICRHNVINVFFMLRRNIEIIC